MNAVNFTWQALLLWRKPDFKALRFWGLVCLPKSFQKPVLALALSAQAMALLLFKQH
jgi:hypothetical protein